MLNYQSPRPTRGFYQVPNITDDDLGPDAFYLYIKLRKLNSNEDNSMRALEEITGLSKWKLKKAKAELMDKCYLDVKQLFDNKYAFYIGKERVEQYKLSYKKSYSRREKNQIKDLKKGSL